MSLPIRGTFLTKSGNFIWSSKKKSIMLLIIVHCNVQLSLILVYTTQQYIPLHYQQKPIFFISTASSDQDRRRNMHRKTWEIQCQFFQIGKVQFQPTLNSGINTICYEWVGARWTRCCTLRRAKNTPTHSFVSRTVNRK